MVRCAQSKQVTVLERKILKREAKEKRPGLVGCPGGTAGIARRRGPTAAQHGEFDLLRVRPGPGPPSLDNLVPPGLPRKSHVGARPDADARSTQRRSSEPPGTHDPPGSASREAGITGARHRARRQVEKLGWPGGRGRRCGPGGRFPGAHLLPLQIARSG